MSKLKTGAKWVLVSAVVAAITFFAVRTFDIRHMPPLQLWHTYVPHEPSISSLDAGNWAGYLKAEEIIFNELRAKVSDKLPANARTPLNRYYPDSLIYPGRYNQDWNRSYILEPAGKPVGAVVLLHGLTDSPYSLRHIARRYAANGFVVVAIRLPGHGTVPSGLSNVTWEEWMAATRLAIREAKRLSGPAAPLHLVGFSNGGALAVKYALDAIENPQLARPDRLILLSPMIGITRFARLAGPSGWPAILPPFAKAAWLSIVPEFNPFKYNSFPVNGARQSSLVARRLQSQINEHAAAGRLAGLAPILTFQSVVDFTVSTRAIVNALYVNLPANGSELVLFDINRNTKFGPLLPRSTETVLARLLPDAPRTFRTTVITNVDPDSAEVVERVTEAGAITEQTRSLGLTYPREVFSLSHLALSFPMNDSLYGMTPDSPPEYGVHLGAMATRGERGILIVSLDSLSRMSSNPFFPYLIERIEEGIGAGGQGGQAAPRN